MDTGPPECTESCEGSNGQTKARLRAKPRPSGDDSQRTPGKQRADLQDQESAGLLVSPHFSMETPHASRSSSPAREATKGDQSFVSSSHTYNVGTPRVMDGKADEADVNYEWQFEILNNLPRDTAMALVEHLKKTESERAKASKYAAELSRSNKELHRRLQVAAPTASSSLVRRYPWVCLSVLGLVLLLTVAGLRKHVVQGLDSLRAVLSDADSPHSPSAPASTALVSQDLAQAVTVGKTEKDAEQASLGKSKLTSDGKHLKQSESVAEMKNGKVVETTVREMMMRETTTKKFDPKMVQQLQTENLQMKLQLERLQLDIDDAIKKGQDMVCWKL